MKIRQSKTKQAQLLEGIAVKTKLSEKKALGGRVQSLPDEPWSWDPAHWVWCLCPVIGNTVFKGLQFVFVMWQTRDQSNPEKLVRENGSQP